MRINPDTCTDVALLAAEVRRLRAVIASATPTLTDAEREAVETAMNAYGSDNASPECAAIEATLWGLLERLQ